MRVALATLGNTGFFPRERLERRAPLGKTARFARNLALFAAAPFIGLAYALALPFVGIAMLVWMAVRREPTAG